ncbi:MAG: hypothetical protein HKO64_04710 [Xanthomonadales bacterium]|nr:hypothetical protein [Gammaproteobacteria bacterium]NNL94900.1 hypothetical protein [Xanthomonadales bacterium]
MQDIESAAKEVGGLRLPSNLEPLAVVGSGSCSIVFKASFRSETVAMKAYRPEAIDRYRKKYDVNIGVYEMSRNREFRKVQELLPYTAKPLSVMGHDGKHSLIFLQEFIKGRPLIEVAEQNDGVPESVLEAGETIVRMAEMNDLHDLGLDPHDVLLRQLRGVWQPVLHDFNGMPQHLYPPNPIIKMAFKTGARKKSHRDYRAIEQWRKL